MKFIPGRTRWRFNHHVHCVGRLRFTMRRSVLLVAVFVSQALPLYAAESELSDDAKLNKPVGASNEIKISVTPQMDITPEFRQSLIRQFENIRTLEEQEDAFSESLGEAYMGYGTLLAQAGRLDEARNMYAKALHSAKINYGVYAIEQRPVLRAMFEMYDAQRNFEKMEIALNQIRWLEKKSLGLHDAYSYDLVLRMGEAFVELYYSNPKYNEVSQVRVKKALHYYSIAVDDYDEVALSERRPPYGELALLYFTSSQMSKELGQVTIDRLRARDFLSRDNKAAVISRSNFLGRGSRRLFSYLNKAEKEKSTEHQVRALRDLGDLYLLFGQHINAAEFYRKAWTMSHELDEHHALVHAFSEPVSIPAFNYVSAPKKVSSKREVVVMPLTVSLNNKGRVKKIHTNASQSAYPKLLNRARRVARNMVFRPAIERGEMVAADGINYNVRVVLRRGEGALQLEGLK